MALNNNLYAVKEYIVHYPEGDSSLQRNKLTFSVKPEDKLHHVIEGDTITQIANRYYGDPILWYIIADANDIDNPFELPVGEELIIPSATQFGNSINQLGINR